MSETTTVDDIAHQVDEAVRDRVRLYNRTHDYLSPLCPRKLCWALLGLFIVQFFSASLPFVLCATGMVILVCVLVDATLLLPGHSKIDAHRLYVDPCRCAEISVFYELSRLAPTREAKERLSDAVGRMITVCCARGESRTATVELTTQFALELLVAEATTTEW